MNVEPTPQRRFWRRNNKDHVERYPAATGPLRGEQLEPRLCLSGVAFARHELVLASAVLAADLDGDSDMDILSGPSLLGGIAWHENTDGKGSFGEPREITS